MPYLGNTQATEGDQGGIEGATLKCGEVTIKVVESDKWLGDYLHCGGLAASVLETLGKREGKVRGAALEIAPIVDD